VARELDTHPSTCVASPLFLSQAPFRLHRVTCPKCGRVFWFALFSDRTPEEVEWARWQQQCRLMEEPCERHAKRVA